MPSAAVIKELRPQLADVAGLTVRYYDTDESVGDRPTVVLIHGTGGDTTTHYPFLLPMLSTRQRVVSIDLSDPGSNRLEVDMLEAQIVGVLEQLGLTSCTLVGYSLGAVIAAAVAGNRPDLVTNLVLIAGWMRTDAQQLLRNDVWAALRNTDIEAAQAFSIFTAYSAPHLQLRNEAERQRLLDAVRFDSFKDSQMDLNRRIDIGATVERIKAQTLVIGCRDDFMVPVHHSKQLFGAIPNARYTEIASGHAVVNERPAQLVHWIDTFNTDPCRYPVGTTVDDPRP